MRQAIVTRYLGATNFRDSRVKATSASGLTLTLSWDHALDVDANHIAAARALATKLQWRGEWHGGGTQGDRGYTFVVVGTQPEFIV